MRFRQFTGAALMRALLALGLTTAACGPFHMGGRQPAYVIFTNDALDQADVYAVVGSSQALRIGSVASLRTDTLRLPTTATDNAGQTNIVVRLLARSYQPSTGPLSIQSEDVLRLRLSADGRSISVLPGR